MAVGALQEAIHGDPKPLQEEHRTARDELILHYFYHNSSNNITVERYSIARSLDFVVNLIL